MQTQRQHSDVLLKSSAQNLSAVFQAVIDPLDNQLGYMG